MSPLSRVAPSLAASRKVSAPRLAPNGRPAWMVERLTWRMVKFTGLRGPAYADLDHVAPLLATREPHTDAVAPELDITIGATIHLTGGTAFYVRESADTVFAEIHRYRSEPEPKKPPMKLSA